MEEKGTRFDHTATENCEKVALLSHRGSIVSVHTARLRFAARDKFNKCVHYPIKLFKSFDVWPKPDAESVPSRASSYVPGVNHKESKLHTEPSDTNRTSTAQIDGFPYHKGRVMLALRPDSLKGWLSRRVRRENPVDRRCRLQNEKIEKLIAADRGESAKDVMVLTLGPRSHELGPVYEFQAHAFTTYTEETQKTFRGPIRLRTLWCMNDILTAMKKEYRLPLGSAAMDAHADTVLRLSGLACGDLFPEPVADAMIELCKDPEIQRFAEEYEQWFFSNKESALHCFDSANRIFDPDYSPTKEDVLHSRRRAKGLEEKIVEFGELRYHFLNPRWGCCSAKKWIYHFENIFSLTFLADISEYDEVLNDDPRYTFLTGTITNYESILRSKFYKDTGIILFLTGVDIFKEKLRTTSLSKHFPEYTGTSDEEALSFVVEQFQKHHQSDHRQFHTYIHTGDIEHTTQCMVTAIDSMIKGKEPATSPVR